MRYLTLIFLVLTNLAHAECYIVGEFEGYASRDNDDFAFESDGMSGQEFMIETSVAGNRVSPNDMKCISGGFRAVLCMADIPGRSSVESWSVYPEDGIAILVKSRNGIGPMNGGMLMRGRILRECENS